MRTPNTKRHAGRRKIRLSSNPTDSVIRVAIAQINCTVGDLEGNAEKIFNAAREAAALGADIVVTPELALTGYPPEDLLLRPALYARCDETMTALVARLAAFPDLHCVIGHPTFEQGHRYNTASVFKGDAPVGRVHKRDLPNYDVFDEERYFTHGTEPFVFDVKGTRFGVVVCEDTWFPRAPAASRAAGAEVLLVPNASPFHVSKLSQRHDVMRANVTPAGLALVYANLVGGQDELVFDGGSFVLDRDGVVVAQMKDFVEAIEVFEFDGAVPRPGSIAPPLVLQEQVYRALVLGVADYVGKNGFPGAIIGLSGGVDSALTLAIAVDALGAERVRAVMMPSRYTADISWIDAREMAGRVGVRYDEIAIAPMFDAFRAQLASQFEGLKEDTTEENIQARVRGTLLMALSNKTGRIVLTTGNKSELATGYCTLYGDMAGGFAVIKDVAKTLVYEVCNWRNASTAFGKSEVIPERIITRPPSAELRDNQTDQDSLPPYEVLDGIMRRFMEEDESGAEIVAAGYAEADVKRVAHLIKLSEYKRRQSPVGIRITHRAFGRDWRYPITNRFQG
jgi:NAD+ synthase (glutamine-hydrolysing)